MVDRTKTNTQFEFSRAIKSITVDSFKREFVIGKGGFGKVWKVV